MASHSKIELKDLVLDTAIGTYGPDDVVPDQHILDLTLMVAQSAVLIRSDEMTHVFDYDPLITDILHLAKDGHRATQEWLMTQIVGLCGTYPQIEGAEIYLRKTPVHDGTGTLGVRLFVDHDILRQFAAHP